MSKKKLWAGRVLSALPVLLLLFSASMKLMKVPAAVIGFAAFGYPPSLLGTIGVVELLCTVVYLIPRTSILGAILLTGYLGGATATHARLADPSFVMAVLVGVLVWAGLYLREPRLAPLLPFRT